MLAFWTSLLFALPGLIVAVSAMLFKPGAVSRKLAALALVGIYFSAAMLVAFGRPPPTVEVQCAGLEFPLPDTRERPLLLRVGGAADQDDLYVPGYPAHAFDLIVAPAAPASQEGGSNNTQATETVALQRVDVDVKTSAQFTRREVVKIGGRLVGLSALRDGDRVMAPGADGQTQELIFAQPGWKLGADAALVSTTGRLPVPNRRIQVPMTEREMTLPVFVARRSEPLVLTAGNSFPKKTLLEPSQAPRRAENPLGLSPLSSVLLVGEANPGDNARVFNRVSLLGMDRTLEVHHSAGTTSVCEWNAPVAIPNGAPLTFSRLSDSPQPVIKPMLRFARVVIEHPERRGPRLLRLFFAEPRRRQFGLQPDMSVVLQARLLAREGDTLIRFGDLARRASETGARAQLRPTGFTLQTPWEQRGETNYGQSFSLGESHRMMLRIVREEGPIRLWLGLAGAALLTVAGGWRRLCDYRLFCVLAAVAALTSMRLVFAHAAAVRPPFNQEAIGLALYALVLVPTVVILAANIVDRLEGSQIGRVGGVPERRLWLWWNLAVIISAASLGVPPASGASVAERIGVWGPFLTLIGVVGWVGWFPTTSCRAWAWLRGLILPGKNRGPLRGYRLLWLGTLLFYTFRLVLTFMGFKERIGGLPLAVIYVPGFLFMFSLGCAQYWRESRLDQPDGYILRRFVSFATILICMHLAISGVLVSDLGMAIYALPPSLLLGMIAVHALPRAGLDRITGTWLAVATLPIVLALAFLFAPRSSIATVEFLSEHEILSDKLRDPDALVTDRQLLRLLQYVDRGKLKSLGTEAAERIVQHLEVMDDYTAQGFIGAGFLRVPVVAAVRDTSLSDNVPAVYLIGQFGVVGALGLIAALVGLALAIPALPESVRHETWAWRRFGWGLSALCASAIVLAGLYMIAANCQLAPFTGRNLYLLGLNSLGDVWESSLLLGLLSIGLRLYEERPAA